MQKDVISVMLFELYQQRSSNWCPFTYKLVLFISPMVGPKALMKKSRGNANLWWSIQDNLNIDLKARRLDGYDPMLLKLCNLHCCRWLETLELDNFDWPKKKIPVTVFLTHSDDPGLFFFFEINSEKQVVHIFSPSPKSHLT